MRAGLALVSEDRRQYGLVPEGSVEDNLALATLRRYATHGWLSHAARSAACAGQVRALGIHAASLATPVAQLSGGNQQKVVLGRWLLAQPRVLLLDEPTRGIDVGARAEIYAIVSALSASGLGIVLVSSDLPEVLGMSHRVLVLRAGRVAAALDGEAATPEAVMSAAALAGGA
jgi:D-xylose transport system ATP-binding protein